MSNHQNSPNTDQPVAFLPVYGQNGGNATLIYFKEGHTVEDLRSTNAVLRAICRQYNVDLIQMRSNYRTYLGCKLFTPLVFSANMIYIGLKSRKPFSQNDGATGYINLKDVLKINQAEDDSKVQCYIYLTGGQIVSSYTSLATFNKRLVNGSLARERFCALQDRSPKGPFNNVRYDQQASNHINDLLKLLADKCFPKDC